MRAAGSDGDEQGELDRAMRRAPRPAVGTMRCSALVIDRSTRLVSEVHRAPEHDIDAVGREPEQPGVERLGERLDQRPGARQAGEAGAARDLAAGDGGRGLRAGFAHSSVRISTASPISRNRRNGPQAASNGG